MRVFVKSDGDSLDFKNKNAEAMKGQESLSPRLVFTALLTVLGGGFHFGFQTAVINPMADVIQKFLVQAFTLRYERVLSESSLAWIWSSIAGLLFIGAALGAALIAPIVHRKGPAKALFYSALFLLMTTPLSALSSLLNSAELFVIARFLSGVGVGMGTASQGVFLAEISPARYRGVISTFGGFSTNIGYIVASALGLPFLWGDESHWPLPYIIEAIPCLVLAVSIIFFFHDSPVFLIRSRNESAAEAAINAYSKGIVAELELIRLQTELKKEQKATNWRFIWEDSASRQALLLATILNITVAFSGITAVTFFGTFLLQSIGFSENQAALANCLSALAGTVGAVTATLCIDRVGRRLLVIGSLLALALINSCMMLLVIGFNATQDVMIGFGFLSLFIVFLFMFSAGIGPTAWFIGAELAPAASRARIQSASVSAQTVFCFVSPVLFYPLQSLIGPLSFLIFIIPLSFSAIFFYRYLPETKGRTLEQIATSLSLRTMVPQEE